MKIHWRYITPITLLILIVTDVVTINQLKVEGSYPEIDAFGWLLTTVSPLTILSVMLISIVNEEGSLRQRLKQLTRPNKKWGPPQVTDRVGWVAHCNLPFEVTVKTTTQTCQLV